MDWVQFTIFFIGVFGLFIWNRSESRNDIRHMDSKIDAHAKETQSLIEAIRQDMRDFHGRLCALEEKNRGK